jgi:hypothetical protein
MIVRTAPAAVVVGNAPTRYNSATNFNTVFLTNAGTSHGSFSSGKPIINASMARGPRVYAPLLLSDKTQVAIYDKKTPIDEWLIERLTEPKAVSV